MITSPQNPLFKTLSSLNRSSFIKKQNLFILSEERIIYEFVQSKPHPHLHLEAWLCSQHHITPTLVPHTPVHVFSQELFKKLDLLDTDSPMALLRYQESSLWTADASLLQQSTVFLPLGDPLNLGAALRSLLAFDIQNVVLLKECAHPYHYKTLTSGRGASLYFSFYQGPSIKDLNSLNLDLLTLDRGGESLLKWQWPNPFFLLVGEEGPGVPQNLRAKKLSIPISPRTESLNATVALSLALFHYRQQNPLPKNL